MADAVRALRQALGGAPLDAEALDALAWDAPAAARVRDEALPLLAELAAQRPAAAAEVPERAVEALVAGLPLREVLQKTGLDARALASPLVRGLLLACAAEATEADLADARAEEVVREAFALLADAALETGAVAAVERLAARLPRAALAHAPFAVLHGGSDVLQARLMALNLRLLGSRVLPPLAYVLWDPLESEDGDLVLAALQVGYVGDLMAHFLAQPALQPAVRVAVHELARRYGASLLDNTIESVLGTVAQRVASLFLELDVQFGLVRADRLALVARVPATYVVTNHPDIARALELSQTSLAAVANLCQDFRGLQLLDLSRARVSALPHASQLLLAAAATHTDEGARFFADRFLPALHTALSVADAPDTRGLQFTLRANLARAGLRIRSQPSVGTV